MDEKTLEGGGFPVTHYTLEEWHQYVKGALTEEEKIEYENHLYECDQCLTLFIEATESELSDFSLENGHTLTEKVMRQLPKEEKKIPFYQKPIFHYTVAAVATIFIMASGLFEYVYNLPTGEMLSNPPSVTEGMLEKTTAWLDQLETINKEGIDR